MNLLFEEDGAFKAGTVLSSTDTSFQVELPTGKRSKVKSSHVLLRFEKPAPAELLQQAQQEAVGLDLDFLWECAPQDEFGFEDLAREYYGSDANVVQQAAVLLRLHGAPVYFHRKGRGRFRPAPADVLKAALAAVERKRQQELLKQQYVDALKSGSVPAPIAQQAIGLLVRPDKNGVEYKALEQAAAELHLTPLKLLLERGAIASAYRWHLENFLATVFPRGIGFAPELPAPSWSQDLPLAEAEAFSIDDSSTTEIDDAFSVQTRGEVVRVGIHIAAPAVALTRSHALDAVAKTRLSTVYAPGIKITMLPPAWIDAFSLNAGCVVPVLSLYADVDAPSAEVKTLSTRVERIRIAANLRHDALDMQVTEESIAAGTLAVPYGQELSFLWRLATRLQAQRERVRGKPEPRGRIDYSIAIDADGFAADENAQVRILARPRGAPLDLIVAELMILANSHWGEWLAQHRVPGIYRAQRLGRVKMSTTPAPHEGIGVACYAWSSSPLRRFVDLVNQRQLLALAQGATPPYAANDAELFGIVSAFDAAYSSYAEFQDRLERYWCLRWLKQQQVQRIGSTVLKGDVLRLDGLPFVFRLPGLPALPRGQRVELDVLDSDEIALHLEARVHQVLSAQAELDDSEVEESEPALSEEAAASAAEAADGSADPAASAASAASASAVPANAAAADSGLPPADVIRVG